VDIQIFKFHKGEIVLGDKEKLKKIEEKLEKNFPRQFEGSVFWGRFQSMVKGRGPCYMITVTEDKEVVGFGLYIVIQNKLGFDWLWGPVGIIHKTEHARRIIREEVKSLAIKEKYYKIRLEHKIESDIVKAGPNSESYNPNSLRYVPQDTIIIDLKKGIETIYKEMKPKGRYNIKVAEKNGVKVRKADLKEDLMSFHKLLLLTAKRDGFGVHGIEFFKNLIESTNQYMQVEIFFAEHEGDLLAGGMLVLYGNHAIYLFGASSNQKRNLMAPYLLHAEMIKRSIELGKEFYDFYGVAPEGVVKHKLSGVTDFKQKFGGFRVIYANDEELVMHRTKWLFLKFLRGLKQGKIKLGFWD